MEMHQVRYFLAVARVLNFTRAAEECHVAQPSLTRAIKQLEDELGSALFRRERNFTHLTEFGQRMRPLLQQCFDSATAAKSLATSLRSGVVAPLPIGISQALNLGILVPHLLDLMRAFKGLELRLVRGGPSMLAEQLKMGDVELVVSGPLGEEWERLESWKLFTEPYRLVVGEAHRLALKKKVHQDDLAHERYLSRAYCENTSDLTAFLRKIGVNLDVSHKVVSEPDLLDLVGAGFGYGLPPRSSISSNAKVRSLELDGLDISRTVSVFAAAGRQRSGAANALIKALRGADWSALDS